MFRPNLGLDTDDVYDNRNGIWARHPTTPFGSRNGSEAMPFIMPPRYHRSVAMLPATDDCRDHLQRPASSYSGLGLDPLPPCGRPTQSDVERSFIIPSGDRRILTTTQPIYGTQDYFDYPISSLHDGGHDLRQALDQFLPSSEDSQSGARSQDHVIRQQFSYSPHSRSPLNILSRGMPQQSCLTDAATLPMRKILATPGTGQPLSKHPQAPTGYPRSTPPNHGACSRCGRVHNNTTGHVTLSRWGAPNPTTGVPQHIILAPAQSSQVQETLNQATSAPQAPVSDAQNPILAHSSKLQRVLKEGLSDRLHALDARDSQTAGPSTKPTKQRSPPFPVPATRTARSPYAELASSTIDSDSDSYSALFTPSPSSTNSPPSTPTPPRSSSPLPPPRRNGSRDADPLVPLPPR